MSTPGASEPWGRVDDDGTVYVRTGDGERAVGQMPDASPAEALAFFRRRFDDLSFEVDLLEQRVKAGTLSPDEAQGALRTVRGNLTDAQAVGDLTALGGRLDAIEQVIAGQAEQRREERARKLESARGEKEKIAEEAERLAAGEDWRNGANRMRELLDAWKALPRLAKSVDDVLWRRFSSARTTYTRRRKQHFAQLNERREEARVTKERLVAEAEELAGSTDWAPTGTRYRDLMRSWKAAGPAPRGVEDKLWKRFRAAQDQFFGARDEVNAEQDRQFAANAEKKDALLVEAEALLPVTDARAARESFRALAERWDAAGKVPRDRMKELEGRFRKVEQAIRGVEDDQWRRTDPEKSARADDMVSKLEKACTDLESQLARAREKGDERTVSDLEESLASRRSFLEMARRAAADFSG
ncbi:MAG TPA: DUF349 domain-containing protein [Nocardioidaceae bacterium]|nr:DUF349 domain-containing protein [Nocardioidaceae bacterium]